MGGWALQISYSSGFTENRPRQNIQPSSPSRLVPVPVPRYPRFFQEWSLLKTIRGNIKGGVDSLSALPFLNKTSMSFKIQFSVGTEKSWMIRKSFHDFSIFSSI